MQSVNVFVSTADDDGPVYINSLTCALPSLPSYISGCVWLPSHMLCLLLPLSALRRLAWLNNVIENQSLFGLTWYHGTKPKGSGKIIQNQPYFHVPGCLPCLIQFGNWTKSACAHQSYFLELSQIIQREAPIGFTAFAYEWYVLHKTKQASCTFWQVPQSPPNTNSQNQCFTAYILVCIILRHPQHRAANVHLLIGLFPHPFILFLLV